MDTDLLMTLVRISSCICMVLTIAVYLYVNKLRNHLGMCLVFILFCRLVPDVYWLFYQFYTDELLKLNGLCRALGYTAYFFVMAAELWSTVFSHNVWKGLKAVNRYNPENMFLAYNMFAWGMAATLTAVIYFLDYYIKTDRYSILLPGVGVTGCWLDFHGKAQTIYVQFPRSIMDAYRVIVFTLTAFDIEKVRRDIRKFNPNDERRTKLKSDNKNFLMLLRLFSIMALTWSLNILSKMTEGDAQKTVMWMDLYFDASFGIIIFVLFILKRSTLRLILKSIR